MLRTYYVHDQASVYMYIYNVMIKMKKKKQQQQQQQQQKNYPIVEVHCTQAIIIL